jgi:aminomethyltransferase
LLKQTPLNQIHRAAGAKMVDFGGWDMPVSYGSQIDEHHAVRTDAGLFDVSHMLAIDMRGPGSRALLHFALANNVEKLTANGKALYSCILSPAGGVLDDLIVYRVDDDSYRVVVNAATAEKDLAWLRSMAAARAPGATLAARRDLAMIAVQGPNARARFWQAIPGAQAATGALKPFSAASVGAYFVARTGYTGEDGFELILPADGAPDVWQALTAAGVTPCGLGARDTLRLEAGMNLYGQDMDEQVSPLESGLAWTVDLTAPRDFSGKASLLARRVGKNLVGLVLLDKGGVLRSHQRVRTTDSDGEVTSGTFSPTLGTSIALARVPSTVATGAIVHVDVRDKQLAARVVKTPFVRNGKSLL